MADSFIIQGPARLSGSIPVYGSKNAALPLLAASLLTSEEIVLQNMPDIRDAESMLNILNDLGVTTSREQDTIRLTAKTTQSAQVSPERVGLLRGSILLLGALLGRNRTVTLPTPGGDIIGARPIDAHLDAFEQLKARVTRGDSTVSIDGSNMQAGPVVLSEFSVTATENILLAAATLPGTTTIELAAAEPHVAALAHLLTAMGATVDGAGTHTITITGNESLGGATFTNIPDMLEAGFFVLLAAATQSELTVTNAPITELLAFFKKLDAIGVRYTLDAETASVSVQPSELRSFRIQTLPYPGLATDLQAPFATLATQVKGTSLIHDPMYEGRFRHIGELQKMGADAIVADPHRVIINGPTKLVGRKISSLDIRAGATLIMAGLVAEGETIIENAEIVERGYAELPERLQEIGADIRIA